MNAARASYQRPPLDEQERNRLITEQLPQVKFIARRIHDRLPRHVSLEDLIHAGIIGLLDAVQKFDPAKHVQLKSYAKFRIRGAILDSLRELDWSPRDLRRKARQLETIERRLRAEIGRAPSETELADGMDMELAEFQQFLGELRGLDVGNLQAAGETESDSHRSALEVRDPQPNPFEQYSAAEGRQRLAQAIAELPERERQVLALYYHEELTMKEIGSVLGIGESRISQIHSAAIIRLRSRMSELLAAKAHA